MADPTGFTVVQGEFLAIPFVSGGVYGINSFGAFSDYSGIVLQNYPGTQYFNDASASSSYSFRQEDIATNRVPTVRRVVLEYRDIGVATVTITLTGVNDSNAVQTATANVSIGNASPTGNIMTAFVDITLTAFRPQLTISRAANAGQVSIVSATLVGEVEDASL